MSTVINTTMAGTPATGRGRKAAREGLVVIRGVYDKAWAAQLQNEGQKLRTVYPHMQKENYDVAEFEFLFTRRPSNRQAFSSDPHTMRILSSLNGEGAEAAALFPGDEDFQRIAILNQLKYAGISNDLIRYDDGNKRQGVGVQVAGVISQFASVDMPVGMPVRLVAPSPRELVSDDRTKRPYTPLTKATLEAIPFTPDTIVKEVSAMLRTYISDSEKWKRAMDPKYRQTGAWVTFIGAWFDHVIMSFMLIADGLEQAKVINPITFRRRDPSAASEDKAPRPYNLQDPNVSKPRQSRSNDAAITDMTTGFGQTSGRNVILGMARAFGMLPGTNDPIPGIHIDAHHKELYTRLKRDLMARVFYDGRIANMGFGFDGKRNPAVEPQTGRVRDTTAMGRMLQHQLNHHRVMTSGFNDVMNRQWEWQIGKVIQGAQKGQTWEYLG